MKYRCRLLKPKESRWYNVEADSPEDALQTLHMDLATPFSSKICRRDTDADEVYFARGEVEGHESWVSRYYQTGIWRKGGVKPPYRSQDDILKSIAADVGWTGDPKKLLEPWDAEETWDDASNRKWSDEHRRVEIIPDQPALTMTPAVEKMGG